MSPPDAYDYTRYLRAKRFIDEQSINLRVWQQFIDALEERARIRILEIGAGIGATAERILSAARVPELHYTLLDRSKVNVENARENLHRWMQEAGYTCRQRDAVLLAQRPDRRRSVRCVAADVFDFIDGTDGSWDVLVAQAFLDLVNLQELLARVDRLLTPHALLYLPIHFDGLTAFEPVDEPSLNRRILHAYHDTMDERRTEYGPSGGSRTGRTLITTLRTFDAAMLSAGSSDWIIFAGRDGFSDAEKYFLYHMLHFVETSVHTHPAVTDDELERWLRRRRQQIEDGTLVFIAHQLDVLCTQASEG